MTIDSSGNIKMGDGVWTNYVNITNAGVLSLEGTANIEGVDATEFGYLDGVTSDIQTQLGNKLEDITGENFASLSDIPTHPGVATKVLETTAGAYAWIDTPSGGGADTFAGFEIDGISQTAIAPTFDFDGTLFSIVEDPADDFDINIETADTDTRGVLSAADWNTFNGKAASGANSDITSLTGLTTPLGAAYGGTGVANNAASTLTISGNFATTLTVTEATSVTLPASGTLLANVVEDTTPQLGGDLDLNTHNIDITAPLASDHTYEGIIDSQAVGESVVFGNLLYFNWTDKEWKLAKADAIGTTPALAIALETKADGATCKLLRMGYIRDDTWDFAGSMVYLSDATAGATTTTAPSTSEHFVQRVGQAKSADIMYFNPSIDIGEVE
jgi:hypothetical protein